MRCFTGELLPLPSLLMNFKVKLYEFNFGAQDIKKTNVPSAMQLKPDGAAMEIITCHE